MNESKNSDINLRKFTQRRDGKKNIAKIKIINLSNVTNKFETLGKQTTIYNKHLKLRKVLYVCEFVKPKGKLTFYYVLQLRRNINYRRITTSRFRMVNVDISLNSIIHTPGSAETDLSYIHIYTLRLYK